MTDEIPAHKIAGRNFVVSETMVSPACDKRIHNLNPQKRLIFRVQTFRPKAR
jgi:hypothetical protein